MPLIQRKVNLLTFPSSSANFSSLHTDFIQFLELTDTFLIFLVFLYFSEYFPFSHYWITIILCRFCAVFAPFVNRVLNIFLRLFFLSYCTFSPPSLHLSLVCLRRALIDANCLWLNCQLLLATSLTFCNNYDFSVLAARQKGSRLTLIIAATKTTVQILWPSVTEQCCTHHEMLQDTPVPNASPCKQY